MIGLKLWRQAETQVRIPLPPFHSHSSLLLELPFLHLKKHSQQAGPQEAKMRC